MGALNTGACIVELSRRTHGVNARITALPHFLLLAGSAEVEASSFLKPFLNDLFERASYLERNETR